ncbi:hypothetical protein TW95_gp0104 [Pandoravirus inopinatum]|uniref:Transmembrane protein n=1 Tax=Pandoravirus inopinatum TaxID=1605721 RepID=A0A0B5IVZ5_9VIRU|nr:hypothetical protein TW95_gp0104 [Pandoravirus inopinatum]AJF96838.1 hypothetical protein [Pandoravirus inopinatum]
MHSVVAIGSWPFGQRRANGCLAIAQDHKYGRVRKDQSALARTRVLLLPGRPFFFSVHTPTPFFVFFFFPLCARVFPIPDVKSTFVRAFFLSLSSACVARAFFFKRKVTRAPFLLKKALHLPIVSAGFMPVFLFRFALFVWRRHRVLRWPVCGRARAANPPRP